MVFATAVECILEQNNITMTSDRTLYRIFYECFMNKSVILWDTDDWSYILVCVSSAHLIDLFLTLFIFCLSCSWIEISADTYHIGWIHGLYGPGLHTFSYLLVFTCVSERINLIWCVSADLSDVLANTSWYVLDDPFKQNTPHFHHF